MKPIFSACAGLFLCVCSSAWAGIVAPSSADVGQSYAISWTNNHNNYCSSSSFNYKVIETHSGVSTTYNVSSKNRTFTKSIPGNYQYAISYRSCFGPQEYYHHYIDIGNVSVTITAAGPAEIHYEYDDLGRLIHVADPVNGDREFEYDKAGNRTRVITE